MFLETVTLKVIIKDNFIIIQTIQIPGITKRVETIIHHQTIHPVEDLDLLSQEVTRSAEAVGLCQDHQEEEEEEDKI